METWYKKTYRATDIISRNQNIITKLQRAFVYIERLNELGFDFAQDIRCVLVYPGNDYYTEMFAPDRIWVVQPKTVRESGLNYLTSLLIHEAWHIVQWRKGVHNVGSRAERGAYLKQRKFLAAIHDSSSIRWLDKAYKEKWWKDADGDHETRPSSNQDAVRSEIVRLVRRYKAGKIKTVRM